MKYNNKTVTIVTLKNAHGMQVDITNFGARIIRILVNDREENLKDVVLGFDAVEDYFPENHSSDFGAVIGRYANRIRDGKLTIDGKNYQLPQNNFTHCLHGGPMGWQYAVYDIAAQTANAVKLTMVSPDGDNNFPGTVSVTVSYTLTDDNAIRIDYHATTDRPTVINMTNHSYFNLNGDAHTTILNHILTINADSYTPIDHTFVPTGEIESVENTPMDFRMPKSIGRDIALDNAQLTNGNGYDHNWVLNTKGNLAQPCAEVFSPQTGIELHVYTTQPGMQVYTGNFLDGTVAGKGGVKYQQRSAICLETQHYPDSPNQHWSESDTLLMPDKPFESTTIFKFTVKQ